MSSITDNPRHADFALATRRALHHPQRLWRGLLLCGFVSIAAFLIAWLEAKLFGKAWIEPLVLAILAGTALRSVWAPPASWLPGVDFCAHFLLEVAVVLLGASLSAATIAAVGPMMIAAIFVVVAVAIIVSFMIGLLFGLPLHMAILVACGNSICGNSAIAAVAPVIDADPDDVAAAIAFTAVLGVIVVLGLPLLGYALGLTATQFGMFSGLTVYAVPQVIAAASPMGMSAIKIGTLVKLVRVLMLGPVCVMLAMMAPYLLRANESRAGFSPGGERPRPPLGRLVPWFIIGFVIMAIARSLGLIPEVVLPMLASMATGLTVVSMAGLGLGVDVRKLVRAGGRVTGTVVLSLLVLGVVSLAAIFLFGVRTAGV